MSAAAPLDPVARRRMRVRDAVIELMTEHGYRFSMEAVAQRAGCSKQTLYSQFGSKQALMRSAMLEGAAAATSCPGASCGGQRENLLAFAVGQLERWSDPSLRAACTLVNAEAHLFPEESRALFTEICDSLQQDLSACLAAAMERGQLRRDDPHMAAELLMGMIQGLDFERQRFYLPRRDSDAARRQWAGFAVDAFLRAFAPPATGASQSASPPTLPDI